MITGKLCINPFQETGIKPLRNMTAPYFIY
jgi:hypothetical protein